MYRFVSNVTYGACFVFGWGGHVAATGMHSLRPTCTQQFGHVLAGCGLGTSRSADLKVFPLVHAFGSYTAQSFNMHNIGECVMCPAANMQA